MVEGSNLGSIPQPLRNDKHGPSLPDMNWVQSDKRRLLRLAACRDSGINPPALTRIVQDENIDPIFIWAHVWQTRKQGHNLGAAIWRIEHYQSPSKEAMAWAEKTIRDGVD